MLNFRKLIDANFALVDSVKIYFDMMLAMAVPMIKTALISVAFILCAQALLSFAPNNMIINICFWVWVGFVFSISIASFFKTSEDIILNKTAQVYANIAKVISLSLKLFAVVAIIIGALAILIIPMFYIKNPLFSLPYKVLVAMFVIAIVPFIYFAPLAVALREANIFNSFTFSYYMVLQRWSNISKSISAQIVFTLMLAFWAYFIISLLFFPNSEDFFNFIFAHATAIEDVSRSLYIRFIFWEIIQIFIFTLVTATFIGINTILFLYFDGSISRMLQEESSEKTKKAVTKKENETKFVTVLAKSKPVSIDTESEEEEIHHKSRKEVLKEIYPDYPEDEYAAGKSNSSSPDDDIVIIEDDYNK